MGSQRKWRHAFVVAAIVAIGIGLSGCLDILQTVGIDRTGAGRYQIAVTAQGIVGDAIKNEKLVNRQNHAVITTSDVGGKVTRTATVDFKSLSEVAFSDEKMSLHVTGRDLFGLGPSHVAFVTSVMIDKAKHDNARGEEANGVGERIVQSIMGDHTYTLTVTVPGSVEHAPAITLGGETYQPTITGDFFGHTVTWRIPLYALLNAQSLDFEVDFWAWGLFNDTKTQLVAND